jgi:hypothetical protein
MRNVTLLFLVLAGCAHLQSPPSENGQNRPLTRADVRKAQRIVVTQAVGALWQGTSTRWEFDSSGKCCALAVFSWDGRKTGEKSLTLPPETFHEVRKILVDSKYFNLPDGFRSFQFEGGGSLEVECAGRKHSISFGEAPPEAKSLWEYLNEQSKKFWQ